MNRTHLKVSTIDRPFLTFAPRAWLKLQFFLHAGPVQVSGFGISAVNDLLHLEDFQTVRQQATPLSTTLDDVAVAEFLSHYDDQATKLTVSSRTWICSHAGTSCQPTTHDKETFGRIFGQSDWAVLCIVAKEGSIYGRQYFRDGPGGSVRLPVRIHWERWPEMVEDISLDSLSELWRSEFEANIEPAPLPPEKRREKKRKPSVESEQ